MIRTGGRGMLSGFGSIGAVSLTTSGALVAGTTITAGTGLTVTAGDATISAGAVNARDGVTGQSLYFPGVMTDVTAGPLTATSGQCYARYVGQAPKLFTAADVRFFLHGAAAVAGGGGDSLNWAEVGIATGTPTGDLTILAAVTISAEAVASSSTGAYVKALSSFSVAQGLGMWIVTGGAYETTQVSYRYPPDTDVLNVVKIRAATRPTLNLNTPLTFTDAATLPNGAASPWLRLKITS